MVKVDIEWTRSEMLYLDLGLIGEGHEEEIFIFHDGDCWVVLEACFDGGRMAHMANEDGSEFDDIEAARLFAERLIASYEAQAQAVKEDTRKNISN